MRQNVLPTKETLFRQSSALLGKAIQNMLKVIIAKQMLTRFQKVFQKTFNIFQKVLRNALSQSVTVKMCLRSVKMHLK